MAANGYDSGLGNVASATIEEIYDIIRAQFLTGATGKQLKPIIMIGAPGVGKTEGIRALTKELNEILGMDENNPKRLGFKTFGISRMQVSDAGLPAMVESKNNPGRKLVTYAYGDILPDVSEGDPERGILFIDEITARSNPMARNQLLNLFDSTRTMGVNYKLPDGWLVVGAGNGENDTDDYEPLAKPVYNKALVFEIVPNPQDWINWASKAELNPSVIAFIRRNPQLLNEVETPSDEYKEAIEERPNGSYSSQRAWEGVSGFITTAENLTNSGMAKHLKTGANAVELMMWNSITSCVGQRAAGAFKAFYKHRASLIPVEQIVSGNGPENLNGVSDEAKYITIQYLVNYMHTKFSEAETTYNRLRADSGLSITNAAMQACTEAGITADSVTHKEITNILGWVSKVGASRTSTGIRVNDIGTVFAKAIQDMLSIFAGYFMNYMRTDANFRSFADILKETGDVINASGV